MADYTSDLYIPPCCLQEDWQRFIPKFIIIESGCWRWIGANQPEGYGIFYFGGKNGKAHRFVYEAFHGKIPDGLHMDHLCRNRWCVNPEHLEPVTQRENILRGTGYSARNYAKTACVNGHPYIAGNFSMTKEGSRRCLVCHRKNESMRLKRRRTTE